MLWFDVEKRYNTTVNDAAGWSNELWFDVEKRYNTTDAQKQYTSEGCGLM